MTMMVMMMSTQETMHIAAAQKKKKGTGGDDDASWKDVFDQLKTITDTGESGKDGHQSAANVKDAENALQQALKKLNITGEEAADSDKGPTNEHDAKGSKTPSTPTPPGPTCSQSILASFSKADPYLNPLYVFVSVLLPLVLLASQFAYIFLIFFEAFQPYYNSGYGTCPGYNVPGNTITPYPNGADAKVKAASNLRRRDFACH